MIWHFLVLLFVVVAGAATVIALLDIFFPVKLPPRSSRIPAEGVITIHGTSAPYAYVWKDETLNRTCLSFANQTNIVICWDSRASGDIASALKTLQGD